MAVSSSSFPLTPDQLPSEPYPPPSDTDTDRFRFRARNSFAHRHINPDIESVVSCGSCCFPPPQPLDSSAFVDSDSPYRTELLRDGFFGKVVDVGGVPVLGSGDISDAALLEAALTLAKQTSLNPELLHILRLEVVYFAVIGRYELLTDIPTYKVLRDDPNTNWDGYRGVGATRWLPATSCAEENLLCLDGDPYKAENICVHENSHTLAGSGGKLPTSRMIDFGDGPEDLDRKLRKLYASNQGLWSNTYASLTYEEMWAEGVQSYYSVNNPFGRVGGDGTHNHVWDRETLKEFDPELFEVVERVFPPDVGFGCPPTDLDDCDCKELVDVCNAALGLTPMPTYGPTRTPAPTKGPTVEPTEGATVEPTERPSGRPTETPTAILTQEPTTSLPTIMPTVEPTEGATVDPTERPIERPAGTPTAILTQEPTTSPPTEGALESPGPTMPTIASPTQSTSRIQAPILSPTLSQTLVPPTSDPTAHPTLVVEEVGTDAPTSLPAMASFEPTVEWKTVDSVTLSGGHVVKCGSLTSLFVAAGAVLPLTLMHVV